MKKKQFKQEGNSAFMDNWFENENTLYKMKENYENELKK